MAITPTTKGTVWVLQIDFLIPQNFTATVLRILCGVGAACYGFRLSGQLGIPQLRAGLGGITRLAVTAGAAIFSQVWPAFTS